MSFDRFERWLERYRDAWESRDPEAVQKIFTEHATYQVTPFREPEMYQEGIRDYWIRATTDQRDVSFGYSMIATNGDTGVCRWNVAFDIPATSEHYELDGIFVFTLAGDERCSEFREWWHQRTRSLESG